MGTHTHTPDIVTDKPDRTGAGKLPCQYLSKPQEIPFTNLDDELLPRPLKLAHILDYSDAVRLLVVHYGDTT